MAEYTQTYWNELIDKYRKGTILDEERFQLEKQALDDPFLFDALEGFSLYENVSEESKKRITTSKIFTLPRIAVAASIIFLMAVMFNLNKNSQKASDNSIAMVLEEDEKVIPNIENNERDLSSDLTTTSTTNESVEPIENPSNDIRPKTVVKKNVEKKRKRSKADETEKIAPSVAEATQDYVKIDIPATEEDISESLNEITNKKDGEIVSAQDETVINTESMEQGRKEAVDLVNVLSFESVVQQQEQQQKLETERVTSELNIKKEQSDRRKRKAKTTLFYEAVPVIGKKIFDDYARERIDKRGLRQEKPQEVTIEFTINKNGSLTNFHHIFSGCPECGSFAISILQNSGEWKTVPSGFSGKARYTFIF